MFLRMLKSSIFNSFLLQLTGRNFSTSSQKNIKVAVLGSSGGIGQPLSLLLKTCPLITHLNMYDIAKHNPGVAMDISHIETNSVVKNFTGPDQLPDAVSEVDIVAVPAGMPRKPGMTRDDLFGSNAQIIKDLADATSKSNPKAFFCIITNPVNSTLPVASEMYKKNGAYDPKSIFGVTTLDICRANRFLGELCQMDPAEINIPVICGHSGITIIPVISQCKPKVDLPEDEIKKLINHVQQAGTMVVNAKAGAGSATQAMAYSGYRFIKSLAKAMKGECVVECTMIRSDVMEGVDYFANPVILGKNGVAENLGIPKLNQFEEELMEKAIPELKKNIQKGVDFVNKKD